jgi:Tfp pilus assembly protein PilF
VLPAVVACGGPDKPAQSGANAADTEATVSKGAGDVPTSNSPEVAKGIEAFDKGDLTTAQSSFEGALQKDPKDVVALYNLGKTHEKAGHKVQAEESYRSALKMRPDFADAAVSLSALYVDQNNFDEASAICRDALKKHPENGGLHMNLGLALAAKNDADNAGKEFEEALKHSPEDVNFHYTYGHWLGVWSIRDPMLKERALEHLRFAMRSEDVGILAGVGHEMRLLREVNGCIQALDRAIGQKDAAELRFERGLCKLGQKDNAGAITDFQAAVASDSKAPLPHYWLGFAFANADKSKDAVGEFKTYLKLDPTGPQAKAAEEKIKILEKKKK